MTRVLITNRGEIALRIVPACRRMDLDRHEFAAGGMHTRWVENEFLAGETSLG